MEQVVGAPRFDPITISSARLLVSFDCAWSFAERQM